MPFKSVDGRREIRTDDVDEATAFLSFGLRSGLATKWRPEAEIGYSSHYFASGDFMFGEMQVTSGWGIQPLDELDVVMTWLPLEGECLLEHGAGNSAAVCDRIVIESARCMSLATFKQPYRGLALGVCSDAVRAEIEISLGRRIEARMDFIVALEPNSRGSAMLNGFAVAIHAGLTGRSPLLSSAIGLRRARDGLINLLLTSVGEGKFADLAGRPRSLSNVNLQRAEDYMRAHADLPIGISDIAAHLDISVRALQYTFKRLRGTTPLAVLLQCRLDGVRVELASGSAVSIAGVAAKWGFTHLGRFSRQYQDAFGERASETLRRGRARE